MAPRIYDFLAVKDVSAYRIRGREAVCISPAKVNLYLYVTGKRPDGYHDLETLMCPLSLHDTVHLRFGVRETAVVCDHPDVPDGPGNIAWKAARKFFDATGHEEPVEIGIEKRIPVAAGLGGGSGNAATVLLALNRYYGNPLSNPELISLAAELGADVPFFIERRPAIAAGIGEVLTPFDGVPGYYVVLAAFDFAVSTASVYQKLNLGLTKNRYQNRKFYFKKHIFDGATDLHNDLEAVTSRDHVAVEDAKQALLGHGAVGALMSGSGPTVFGLFTDKASAISIDMWTLSRAMPTSVSELMVARLIV